MIKFFKKFHEDKLYSVFYNTNPIWSHINYNKLEEVYNKNTTVFRCINLISEYANSMKISSENTKINKFLNESFSEIITNLLIYGNSFIHKDLSVIPVKNISIITNKFDKIVGYKDINNNYETSEILHLKYDNNHKIYGVGPLQVAMKWIDICNFIQDYIAGMMQNGGKPSGILSYGNILNDNEKTSFREKFKNLYRNITHNGSVVVAEGKFEWQSIGIEPEKLHLLEHWNNSVKEIGNSFGVPVILLGINNSTFANYRNARQHFKEDVIIPFVINIINKFNFFFQEKIHINTQHIEILQEQIWTSNILTINEKRILLGYPPIEGGNVW